MKAIRNITLSGVHIIFKGVLCDIAYFITTEVHLLQTQYVYC
jgi:hypothetical protein